MDVLFTKNKRKCIQMALTLQQIIDEADVLIPNAYSAADKVNWLNMIHQEFFDVVKIPNVVTFTSIANTGNYTLSATNIRSKNIDKVILGNSIYLSILYDTVQPNQNYFTLNETTLAITLNPAPVTSSSVGIVRYSAINTTTFTSSSLSVIPDAPSEYHWIFVIGLCEKLAKAMDDSAKANNYGNDYKNSLTIAAQNYQKVG